MSQRNVKPYIVGIDPGAKGGMACLRVEEGAPPTLLFVEDLPYLAGRLDAQAMARLLENWGIIHHVYVEKAQVMPARNADGTSRQTGTAGRFNYGVSYGLILGTLIGMNVPFEEIAPQTWKKALGLGKDKEAARRLAKAQFPYVADAFNRVRDDGRAEAALLAKFGVAKWAKNGD